VHRGYSCAMPAARRPVSTRVLLIDGHPVSLRGLAREIEATPDLEIVGAVGELTEGVLLTQELRPVVVVYGASDGRSDPVMATRALQAALPDVAVLIFGGPEAIAGAAIAAGAAGYVAKSAPVPLIIEAIHALARGETVVGRSFRNSAFRRTTSRAITAPRLTVREWEVLHLLEEGLNAAQIADRLLISRNTARNYVQRLLTKLGAHSRLEAVAVARRSGLLGAA
jgi:two-component system nitrate/nitrite response regulator NarL